MIICKNTVSSGEDAPGCNRCALLGSLGCVSFLPLLNKAGMSIPLGIFVHLPHWFKRKSATSGISGGKERTGSGHIREHWGEEEQLPLSSRDRKSYLFLGFHSCSQLDRMLENGPSD